VSEKVTKQKLKMYIILLRFEEHSVCKKSKQRKSIFCFFNAFLQNEEHLLRNNWLSIKYGKVAQNMLCKEYHQANY